MQLLWVRGRTPGCLQCQGQLRLLSSMTLLGARWTWAEMGTFSSFVSVFQFLCAARLTRVLGQDQGWEAKPALACHDLLTWQVWISLTRPQLRTVLVQLVKDCRVAAPGFTDNLWQPSRSFKLLNCKPVVFNVMHTAIQLHTDGKSNKIRNFEHPQHPLLTSVQLRAPKPGTSWNSLCASWCSQDRCHVSGQAARVYGSMTINVRIYELYDMVCSGLAWCRMVWHVCTHD